MELKINDFMGMVGKEKVQTKVGGRPKNEEKPNQEFRLVFIKTIVGYHLK
jgi:hypothetical protein